MVDKIKSKVIILDLTIRFKTSSTQPKYINDKKIKIYNPKIIAYNKTKYKIQNIQFIGLFIGSCGTISKFVLNF